MKRVAWLLPLVLALGCSGDAGHGDEESKPAGDNAAAKPGATKPAETPRQAIDAIKNLGGKVTLDRGAVIGVVLGGANVTDDTLKHLKVLTKLQVLYLSSANVTDDGLAHLKKLPDLQVVYVLRTKVTDAGVKQLQDVLPNCRISRGPARREVAER